MSIAALTKTTLIVAISDKQAVLDKLQHQGLLHLIALNKQQDKILQNNEKTREDSPLSLPYKTQEALRYLLTSPHKITACSTEEKINTATIVESSLANQALRRKLLDQRDALKVFIAIRKEWGDFEFPPKEELAGIHFWFYVIPQSKMHLLKQVSLPWQQVGSRHGRHLIVLLAQEEPDYDELPIARIHTGRHSLQTLKKELRDIQRQIDEAVLERASLTRWRNLLTAKIAAAEDLADMYRAEQGCLQDKDLCIIQGWLPQQHHKAFIDSCQAMGIAWSCEGVCADDQPPTLLQPPAWAQGARQIVEFFQIPAYRSWDPSAVVWLSFCLFYAMIISDAGYAAIMAALLLLSGKKLRRHKDRKGIYTLAMGMTATALLWGIMVGSYFGLTPKPEHWLAHLQIFNLQNFDQMMQLSVGLGVFHLLIANITKAWYLRPQSSALAPLGWSLGFAGAYIYWLHYLQLPPLQNVAWGQFAIISLSAGALLVLCFSDNRPLTSSKALLFRALLGLKALTGLSKGFGDVLSYLRLFALGLSSAQLALTFNAIAFSLIESIPGIGILLCAIVLVLGHLLNFALGIMGGVIHGLRLNLIEFSNWGISEEGYPYQAFAKREKEQWNK